MVLRLEPFLRTTVALVKLAPLTVRVKPALPAGAVAGEIEVIVGIPLPPEAGPMEKPNAFDAPPPGEGVTTVTGIVPAFNKSLAGITAVSCVGLTKVVPRLLPFHCTLEEETKFCPLTLMVTPLAPAVPAAGAMDVMKGAGLVIKTPVAVDRPPPGAGFITLIAPVPEACTSAAVIATASNVELTKLTGRAELFHSTWELETNPVPPTNNENAPDRA